jgi:hypothetical protein
MGLILFSPVAYVAPEDMDLLEATQIVFTRWADQWMDTTAYRLPNEPFKEPTGAPWAALDILEVEMDRGTLGPRGNRRMTRRAVLTIELNAIADIGVSAMNVMIRSIQNMFEGYRAGGLWFESVLPQRFGEVGRTYKVVVECAFQYSERK